MLKLFKKDYQDQLFKSIENNNISQLKYALLKGADINLKNENGKSALKMAIYGRNVRERGVLVALGTEEEIIRLILEAGANVNEKDEIGSTLLMNGVYYPPYFSTEIAQLLIEKGIDINAEDKVGNTTLSLALSNSSPDDINVALTYLLLSEGAIIRKTDKKIFTNYFVFICGFVPIIEFVGLFIDRGVDINALSDQGMASETALNHSTHNGHLELVEFLIKKGADVNKTREGSSSPLITAVRGYLAILNLNESENIRSSTGNVFSRNKFAQRYFSIIKLLIENGADKYYKNEYDDQTAYDMVSKSGNVELINIFNSIDSKQK